MGLNHHAQVNQTAMQLYLARQSPPWLTPSYPHTPDSNATIPVKKKPHGLTPSRPLTPDSNVNIPS